MTAPGRHVLTGVRSDAAVRSNVGVVNISATSTNFIITTFDADGVELASVSKRVRSFSMSQWNLEQLGVATLSTPGRVEIVIDPDTVDWDPCDLDINNLDLDTVLFLSYASRIDQATSDAEFQPGQSDWSAYQDLCGTSPGLTGVGPRFSFHD